MIITWPLELSTFPKIPKKCLFFSDTLLNLVYILSFYLFIYLFLVSETEEQTLKLFSLTIKHHLYHHVCSNGINMTWSSSYCSLDRGENPPWSFQTKNWWTEIWETLGRFTSHTWETHPVWTGLWASTRKYYKPRVIESELRAAFKHTHAR